MTLTNEIDLPVTTIEINGVKFMADTRQVQPRHFRIGDRVKLLKKQYGDTYKSYAGVIVGVDAFKNLPTIVVAYLDADYSGAKVSFEYLNSQTKDAELCLMTDGEAMPAIEEIVDVFDREIRSLQAKIVELETKRAYFLRKYGITIGAAGADVATAATA